MFLNCDSKGRRDTPLSMAAAEVGSDIVFMGEMSSLSIWKLTLYKLQHKVKS